MAREPVSGVQQPSRSAVGRKTGQQVTMQSVQDNRSIGEQAGRSVDAREDRKGDQQIWRHAGLHKDIEKTQEPSGTDVSASRSRGIQVSRQPRKHVGK